MVLFILVDDSRGRYWLCTCSNVAWTWLLACGGLIWWQGGRKESFNWVMTAGKWNELPQMLAVPKGESSGTIYLDHILVELLNVHHSSSAFPALWVVPDKILDINMIPYLQGWQGASVFLPFFMLATVSLGQCFFPVSEGLRPGWMRAITSHWYWDRITDWSAKNYKS